MNLGHHQNLSAHHRQIKYLRKRERNKIRDLLHLLLCYHSKNNKMGYLYFPYFQLQIFFSWDPKNLKKIILRIYRSITIKSQREINDTKKYKYWVLIIHLTTWETRRQCRIRHPTCDYIHSRQWSNWKECNSIWRFSTNIRKKELKSSTYRLQFIT